MVTKRQAYQALFDLHKEGLAGAKCPSCGALCSSGIWSGCDYGLYDSDCCPEPSVQPANGSGCGKWQELASMVLVGKDHFQVEDHISSKQMTALLSLYEAFAKHGLISISYGEAAVWSLSGEEAGFEDFDSPEGKWTQLWTALICG